MTEKPLLLLVDDEPNNLHLLSLDLEDLYDVVTAKDGQEGWQILQQYKGRIKTILLDRMMPNMNGMELLKKIKSDSALSNIPVIMQTAAAEKSQVIEGIEAGAYYYLTKPYDKDIMRSIVSAAVNDYAQYSKMKSELKTFKNKLHLIMDSNFQIQTLDDSYYLATFIANFFPSPERVVFGISELFINAIEHGNCGISYDEKTKLNKDNRWKEEVEKRIKENKDKYVQVKYEKREKEILLTIKDKGDGFNWNEYMEISAERATDSHGRGIALSKAMSFDEIEYRGNGNEVHCKIYINDPIEA